MCRMLERIWMKKPKQTCSKRCDAIERDGLTYLQDGEVEALKAF